MFKKLFFLVFIFSLFVSSGINSVSVQAATKSPIVSSMYGTPYNNTLQFDSKTCTDDYKRLNVNITNVKMEDYKAVASSGGIAGKIIDVINQGIFYFGQGFSTLLFYTGCNLGISPSQLLQLMFFPVVLDSYSFLSDIGTAVQTISVCILACITVLSIYELNKKAGSINEELLDKLGKFLVSAGIIAFSKFILQGIFDISNILSYYISNYSVNIHMNPSNNSVTLPVTLLDYPGIFASYLDISFSPSTIGGAITNAVATVSFTDLMLSIIVIVKIIVLVFMTKDLLKIAIYGMRRIILLVSAPVLLPVLAGLIPSNKTADIFNKYLRSVFASSFSPVLFGLIYLASAPFVIENLVHMISAPLLRVFVLGFFLNILSSIPGYVDSLIGSSTSLGNPHYDKSVASSNFGTLRGIRGERQHISRIGQSLGKTEKGAGIHRIAGAYGKRKMQNFIYGKK